MVKKLKDKWVFGFLKDLLSVLTLKQRKALTRLQFMMIFMAILELISIASIIPFMALVGNQDVLTNNAMLFRLYTELGFSSPSDFLLLLGAGVLAALTISSLFSIYVTWKISHFGSGVGMEISTALYRYYLQQPWLFHANNNSSSLSKQIAIETNRVASQVVMQLLQANVRLIVILFISISIFIYDPLIAVVGVSVIGMAYILIYQNVKNILKNNGVMISTSSSARFKLMNEGFGGIKDLLLLNRQEKYVKDFELASKNMAKASATNSAFGLLPRYLMELITFGSLIGLVLYLVSHLEGDLGKILPVLGLYALAGLKLLPALQQTYVAISVVKGNTAAFSAIEKDLKAAREKESLKPALPLVDGSRITFSRSLEIQNLTFSYPEAQKLALDKVNLIIQRNQTVGIVGHSGSGKSTLIDFLLGILPIAKGQLLIDGVEVDGSNLAQWQRLVGYVPQSIFLSEASIAENIAFGLREDEIDMAKVQKALELSHLKELVDSLPDGLKTRVGERGVKLSGGQRQRIGIARALYNEPEVLVFDEATSALDGVTEAMIMDAIHDFKGQKTIIMIAHRLKTVQNCDVLYLLDQGKIIEKGTFEELVASNHVFKEMSEKS